MMYSKRVAGILVVLVLSLQSLTSSAQTFAEWWNQKNTQKKYLLQQIAALQIYIGYAKKGYDIAGKGLGLVKDITGGEFSLHRNFFASLAAVNPAIAKSSQVAGIISYQLGIMTALKQWKPADLNPSEWDYVSLVKSSLMSGCAADLDELFMLVTAGKLEMKDDERMQRLDRLLLSMQDKYQFAASFTTDLQLLIRQKTKEQESINQTRRLHEVN